MSLAGILCRISVPYLTIESRSQPHFILPDRLRNLIKRQTCTPSTQSSDGNQTNGITFTRLGLEEHRIICWQSILSSRSGWNKLQQGELDNDEKESGYDALWLKTCRKDGNGFKSHVRRPHPIYNEARRTHVMKSMGLSWRNMNNKDDREDVFPTSAMEDTSAGYSGRNRGR